MYFLKNNSCPFQDDIILNSNIYSRIIFGAFNFAECMNYDMPWDRCTELESRVDALQHTTYAADVSSNKGRGRRKSLGAAGRWKLAGGSLYWAPCIHGHHSRSCDLLRIALTEEYLPLTSTYSPPNYTHTQAASTTRGWRVPYPYPFPLPEICHSSTPLVLKRLC